LQGVNPTTGLLVFTAKNQNLIFSVPLVGSIVGAAVAPILNARLGRKWPLIGAYLLSFGGIFLQIFAPNLIAFVLGRFWNSIVMGIAMSTAPLYLAEVVPATIRGATVTSMNILNLVAGVISTFTVYGTQHRTDSTSYKIPLAVQFALPAILIPLTFFIPESPQWYISKGRMDEARKNLRKLRGFSDVQVDEELRVMKMSEENERQLTADVKFWDIFNKKNIARTLTAGSIYSFNQISGIILSTTYATVFLTQIGAGDPFTLTVVSSVCVLLGTIVAPFVIDRFGRRPLALSGMSLLLIIDMIAGGLAFNTSNRSSALAIAAVSFIFNFIWAASFYSLSNVLPSEIATMKLRNYTMAYTIGCSYVTAVITTLAVPQLVSEDAGNLGAKAYLIFGGCMAGIIVFVYFLVPETRNRSFAEIDEIYDAKIPMRHWRNYETSNEAKTATALPASKLGGAHV